MPAEENTDTAINALGKEQPPHGSYPAGVGNWAMRYDTLPDIEEPHAANSPQNRPAVLLIGTIVELGDLRLDHFGLQPARHRYSPDHWVTILIHDCVANGVLHHAPPFWPCRHKTPPADTGGVVR